MQNEKAQGLKDGLVKLIEALAVRGESLDSHSQ